MTYWQPADRFGGVIDVSHHNGAIDWPRVKAAGIELAFIKATQGDRYTDPMFARNLAGATGAGLMAVPYHFVTEADPSAQCDHLLGEAIARPPFMVDWEIDPATGRRPPLNVMETFCRELRIRTTRDPLAYHGMYDLSSPQINAYPWMVPKYGPQPQGPRWLFWQYTPSGTVDGVAGPVDRSVFAGTLDELRAWWRDGSMPAGFEDAPGSPQHPAVLAGDVAGDPVPAPAAPPGADGEVAAAVRVLQMALNAAGAAPRLRVDGDPGPRTQAACEAWRRR